MAKWERVSLGVLAFCVIALAWRLADDGAQARQAADRERRLEAQLSDKTRVEVAELNEKCATRAAARFRSLRYPQVEKSNDIETAEYQSHYNAKMNRCLMVVDSDQFSNNGKNFTHILMDVDEQRQFAEYLWFSDKKKSDSEQKPIKCDLIPSQSRARTCADEDEYKAFVARYME